MIEQMENLCKELLFELTDESKIDAEIEPLVTQLKALDFAYEVLPGIQATNRDLLFYWIENEAKALADCTIEEIIERQKKHIERQEALEAWLRHETVKAKAKESTTYLLINKMMTGMTEDQKKKIRSLMKKRVATKGAAPRKRKVPTKSGRTKGIQRMMGLGFTEEQARAMVKDE